MQFRITLALLALSATLLLNGCVDRTKPHLSQLSGGRHGTLMVGSGVKVGGYFVNDGANFTGLKVKLEGTAITDGLLAPPAVDQSRVEVGEIDHDAALMHKEYLFKGPTYKYTPTFSHSGSSIECEFPTLFCRQGRLMFIEVCLDGIKDGKGTLTMTIYPSEHPDLAIKEVCESTFWNATIFKHIQ